ncbi:MAG: YfbK domain-containing protein, partial [Myxococcota bacterium]
MSFKSLSSRAFALITVTALIAGCAADAEKSKFESASEESGSAAASSTTDYERKQPAAKRAPVRKVDEAQASSAPAPEQQPVEVEAKEEAEPTADSVEAPSPTGRTRAKVKKRRVRSDSDSSAALGGARSMNEARPRPKPADKQKSVSNTEDYKNYGVNEMTSTAEDNKSTFSVDVDTGSYTISRRKLQSGQIPPASSVRVEEFVNYFRYDYPDPDSGPFAVHMEGAPSPFDSTGERQLLRVGVQGDRITRTERKPVHLTFLVDVSGSMSSRDKLGLAKKSLQVLTNNLREGDTVAIATYAGRVAEILPPTSVENRGRIMTALESLKSGGSTAMNSGLELAYKLALKDYKKDHVNRVIVLSDGDANVGASSHNQILKRIRHFVDEGVTLSTIGFGMGNYKDTMMEQLANKGNGNYYYIDSMDEARKVFGEQVDGTLQVIAKDVKIQVEFDEDKVASYRLIGYENRDIADKDFRNDAVDAGEIGAGHTVTALYELQLQDGADGKLGTVRVRHKEPQGAKASEQAFQLTSGDMRADLREASRDFQFAVAVAGFAEILRNSPYAEQISLALVEELAQGATQRGQADRQEFI